MLTFLCAAILAVASAINPAAVITFVGGGNYNYAVSPTLIVAFNASLSTATKDCRRATLVYGTASGASTNDNCNLPYKSSNGNSIVSFTLGNATVPNGDVSLLAATLINSLSPVMTFVVSGAPSPFDGLLWSRPLGALQLATFSTRAWWQNAASFHFSSVARCQSFVVDIDTDCPLKSTCSGASPDVTVTSLGTGQKAALCAINNFQLLDFDGATVIAF